MRKAAVSLLIAPMLVFSGQSDAACFGTAAISCNPWNDSVENDKYFQWGGRVRHKGTKTGTIQVFCPVFNPMFSHLPDKNKFSGSASTWNTFYVTYKDPDEIGDKYKVKASLRSVADNGQIKTIATVDSNKDGEGAKVTKMQANFGGEKFNFSTTHYFIQASIYRKDTQKLPEFVAYNLCGVVQ